jgi:hypothetical protein
MFRLIRWLCMPIARRLGVWPIGVYFALLVPITVLRRVIYPPSAEAMAYIPEGVIPALLGLFFVVFPLWAWLFDRKWYRVPPRASETDGSAASGDE